MCGRNKWDYVLEKALHLDLYRRPFMFNLPDKSTKYRTLLGSVLSVLTVAIMLSYAYLKLIKLQSYQDYVINEAYREQLFDTKFALSQANGFQVAAAVTNFDGNPEEIEDPEIGEVKFYLKQWGIDDDSPSISFKEVKSRPCEEKDFNLGARLLSESESSFFRVDLFSLKDIYNYSSKMKCLDSTNSTEIFGNYNTDKASNFMIVFEKCNKEERKCKSENDIKLWLQ